MIRISKLTDYGIVLLTHIGRGAAGALHTARGLAEASGVPHPTVGKLLKALCRAGLVDAVRGPRGGYALARPPASISVVDIIAALEGPIAITDCGTQRACELEPVCPVRGHWLQINETVVRALRTLTLLDLCSPPCAGEVPDAARDALVPLAGARRPPDR